MAIKAPKAPTLLKVFVKNFSNKLYLRFYSIAYYHAVTLLITANTTV